MFFVPLVQVIYESFFVLLGAEVETRDPPITENTPLYTHKRYMRVM